MSKLEQSRQSPVIFLNYRKEDSKDATTRLHDDLEYALGTGSVFIDFRSMNPGEQWPISIHEKLNAADIVIVVIGRDWLKVSDPNTYQRRLDAKEDWVRIEIEEALRAKKIIIPVLVRDAEPLTKMSGLPDSIKDLLDRQTISITSENWREDMEHLLEVLSAHGIQSLRSIAERPVRSESSMLGVIDYFYRRIGQANFGQSDSPIPYSRIVNCTGVSNLWEFIDDLTLQNLPLKQAPALSIKGQLSPYAPLLFGNPTYKRQLHLGLRKGAVQLIEELGYEFGELLNGLLSYSAGQMVIKPYFEGEYIYLGLYESIVRNSIPVMVDRQYYNSTVGPLFRQFNCLEVGIKAFLGEIPNYTQEALNDFGITERLRFILDEESIKQVGRPNYALFVRGDDGSSIDVVEERPSSSRYLDGDVWVANASNSLITRFIDISSSQDMLNAVTQITHELRMSTFGHGVVSSFDVRVVPIEDKIPNHVLSADQLRQSRVQ